MDFGCSIIVLSSSNVHWKAFIQSILKHTTLVDFIVWAKMVLKNKSNFYSMLGGNAGDHVVNLLVVQELWLVPFSSYFLMM